MSNIQASELMVNGIKYVPAYASSATNFTGPVQIVVLQRGWVLVGKFEQNGDKCSLANAQVIRRWGTTEGLGELASSGKLKDTQLEKCGGLVTFDARTVVMQIAVAESVANSLIA